MALVLSPSSSTIADMFSAPDWSKMALVSGEILGCPLAMVNETAAINTADIPSAVRGVERKTMYARAESAVPVNAVLAASVVYGLLNETVYTPNSFFSCCCDVSLIENLCLITFNLESEYQFTLSQADYT